MAGLASNFSADGFPGTKLMAGMCIVVYGLCMLTESNPQGLSLFRPFESWTTVRFGALVGLVFQYEPWRLLSAVFVHSSLIHIGMNMLALVSLGRTLEQHFRTPRFLVLYLLTGIIGFATTMWWRESHAFSVGASGSLFGLLGAYIAVLAVRRNPGWHRVFFSNLILAAALAYFANVDNAAHLGGFVSGALIGFLFEIERQPRRRDMLLAIPAGLLVVAAFVSIFLSVRSPTWKAAKHYEEEATRLRPDSE